MPNPRCSSACDCTCVLTRMDHCLVNNSSMTFALELIWHALRYQFIPNCLSLNLFRSSHACHDMCSILLLPVYSLFKCFRSSHACHMIVFGSVLACVQPVQMFQMLSCMVAMCSVLFLPMQSLLTSFRSSLTRFADFVSLFCHY